MHVDFLFHTEKSEAMPEYVYVYIIEEIARILTLLCTQFILMLLAENAMVGGI